MLENSEGLLGRLNSEQPIEGVLEIAPMEIKIVAGEGIDVKKEVSKYTITNIDGASVHNIDPESHQDIREQMTELAEGLETKVDKIEGKQLSTNDYTDKEKNKLAELHNYDDAEIKEELKLTKTAIEELDGKTINIENKVSLIEGTTEKVQTDIKSVKENMQSIEEDISGIDISISHLDTNMTQLNTSMSQLSTDVSKVKSDMSKVESNVITIEGNITNINGEIAEIEENLNHLDDIKANRTEIPTKISQLTNDNLFITDDDIKNVYAKKAEIPDVSEFIKKTVDNLINYYKKSETYTQSEINQLIGAIKTVSMKVLPEKPTTGESNVIYLIPSKKQTAENVYEEWIYVDNKWELIGSTQVDLSNYYNKEEINTLLRDYVTYNDLEDALEDYVTIAMKYSFVKDGLVNNTIELTDAEKLKIESWLGLSENYLTYYNETPYQVNGDYNPTHKKYVDDNIKVLDDKLKELELFKFPNMTIVGTPTIQSGQVSGFSLTDYLEFPFLVDFRGRPFEINFAFTTGSDITTQQNILDSVYGLALAIKNGHILMAISYNGTSWANQYTGTLNIEPDTTYVYKISWNGMLYKIQYYNGTEYVNDFYFASTQQPSPKQMFIGVSKLSSNYFKGSINLNYANLIVDGNVVWTGMDDVGISSRLAIDLSNIDTAGINYINSLIDDKIPDTSKYLDKNSSAINILKGKIQIGDHTNNITNAILHIRNVGDSSITGAKVNGACYSVNGDGTASLQHKTYNDNGTGAKNAAVLRMSNKGIQFAVNTGTGTTPTEAMYKELATQEYVDTHSGGKTNYLGNVSQYASYETPLNLTDFEIGTYYLSASASDVALYAKLDYDGSSTIDGIYLDSLNQADFILLEITEKFDKKKENQSIGTINFNKFVESSNYGFVGRDLVFINIYGKTLNMAARDMRTLNVLCVDKDQEISSIHTYSTYLPESSLTPTSNSQLVNKKYVDDQIAEKITQALEASY